MPDLDFFAAAYENGQLAGRAVRWLLLLAIGFKLVQRIARGSWGPGFRRSPLGAAVGLVAVVVALIASVAYDFGGNSRAVASSAAPELSTIRADMMRGCLDQGQIRSICECYTDEVLRRVDNRRERFAALNREWDAREAAGQGPPPMLVEAAQNCAAQGG
jgi:hypothetical protein